MLSATNINDDKICDLNKVRCITKDEYKTQNERTKIQNGDILLTIVGTMGRSCIYSGVPKNVCFQRSVSVLTTLIDNNYLKIVFDSKYIQDYMQFNAIGTAQKGFYLNQLSNLIIPVPPLNEQIRISKIISNVKDKISIITVNLKDIESITQEIRFKILESVFDENSSYKSYFKKISFEDDVEIFDYIRKPINSSEREKRIQNDQKLYPYYGSTSQAGYIDDYLLDGEFVLLGEDAAPFLDRNAEKSYIVKGKFWVNNHAHILKSKTNNKFLKYYLDWFDYQGYVSGTTRLKLNQQMMKKIPLLTCDISIKKQIVFFIEQSFQLLNLISQ